MIPVDVDRVFGGLARARVAVLGDFCVDHYLVIDPDWKELSVETGLPVQGVADERTAPGGAGNVAANVRALGVAEVHCLGCVGDDTYGVALSDALGKLGCDASGLVVQRKGFATRAYVKPYRDGSELPRLDHGVHNRISPETTREIVRRLEALLPGIDAVILNQQVTAGVWSEELFGEVARLGRERPGPAWVADSRDVPRRFAGMTVKLNAAEAARLSGRDVRLGEPVAEAETDADLERLFGELGGAVVITRGGNGAVAMDASGRCAVPGVHVIGDTDPVGAGDTFTSALAACLASGAGLEAAVIVANWAASVTVRKLRETGTASEEEVRAVAAASDYVYEPELAANPRRAEYLEGLDIEVIRRRSARGAAFALFDHDGTVSTLREGWERVMEPMMVRAILGERHDEVDDRTYERVVERVRRYIDRSTGVPTLRQMRGLVEMVRDSGFVPESEVNDIHGYKAVYDEALMAVVNDRLARLARGERDVSDFVVKGAVEFLSALRERGVRLGLASGTDEAHVVREAEALGYAALFDGGIHGATGDVDRCSKREVLERVLAGAARGGGEGVLVFGDGPVEIREGRKRGAVTVAVASDEIRRHGWNMSKRPRLVRAGADYLIPDWSQREGLVETLFA